MDKIKPQKVKLPLNMPSPKQLVEGTKLVPDHLAAVVHQFFLAYIHAKRKSKRKGAGYLEPYDWFPVNSSILKGIGSSNYRTYVALLVEKKVIEPRLNVEGNESYLPGERSKQYRFIPPYDMLGRFTFREYVIKDNRTIKSILHSRDGYKESNFLNAARGSSSMVSQEVVDYLRHSLQILYLDDGMVKDLIGTLPIEEQDLQKHIVEKLPNNIRFDNFGHRMHTWLTNLKKELRPGLRFSGQDSLCIIDIKNSQPFFASIAINPHIAPILLAPEYPVIKNILETNCCQLEEEFREDCKSGHIYDLFAHELNLTRESTKTAFFAGVMFRNRIVIDETAKKLASAFKHKYPGTNAIFTKLRNLSKGDLLPIKLSLIDRSMKSHDKFRGHKLLPLLLQRAESRMVYSHIIPNFIESGIPCTATIHDSFVMPVKFKALAIEAIEKSFRRIGIEPPMLSIQHL